MLSDFGNRVVEIFDFDFDFEDCCAGQLGGQHRDQAHNGGVPGEPGLPLHHPAPRNLPDRQEPIPGEPNILQDDLEAGGGEPAGLADGEHGAAGHADSHGGPLQHRVLHHPAFGVCRYYYF